MDEDTRELIQRLCTRAGMIMEDASVLAVTSPQEQRLDQLRRAADRISALIAAAAALRDG